MTVTVFEEITTESKLPNQFNYLNIILFRKTCLLNPMKPRHVPLLGHQGPFHRTCHSLTITMATVLHSQSKSRLSLYLSLNDKLSLMTSSMKWAPGTCILSAESQKGVNAV